MNISSKGRYALMLMTDIAKNEGINSISAIAQRQNLSVKYLEQIVSRLIKSGLLNAVRGHKGGYTLSKKAEEISLKDILMATGDAGPIIECLNGKCARKEECDTYDIGNKLNNLISSYLESISLKDLIEKNF